ncbi:MAG TPA: hypothetical protein PKH02_02035 [Bacteroidales bacterium]|nr:hypothetical protein [Bacteroidales bacterium]
MKERVIKNWQTSLIAIVLLIASLTFVWFQKITWGEFATFLPTVFGLLWVKDSFLKSIIGGKGKVGMFILLALTVTGCITKQRCNDLFPCKGSVISNTDSVTSTIKEVIVKDTTVYVVDSNLLRAYLGCDSLGNVYLKEIATLKESKNLKTTFSLQNNQLDVACKIDSAAVVVSWNEKHTKTTTIVKKDRKETIPLEVNKLSGWQWFWIRAGQIMAAFLIITLIIIFYRLWKRK